MRPFSVLLVIAMIALRCATSPAPALRQNVELLPIESDRDIDALLPQLSNWGRWGTDDQLGTLNYITPAAVRQAVRLVTVGKAVSLARPVRLAGNEGIRRAQYEMMKDEYGSRDYLGGIWHGFAQTHLDALCHGFADPDRMFNGISTREVTEEGCSKLDISVIATKGVTGRGVLLDIAALRGGALQPGTAISVEDLEAAMGRQGVAIQPGDVLVVRTGAGARNTREQRAGLHPECLPWIKNKQIALLMSDGDSDAVPLPGFERWASAMHSVGIPYLGLPLVDNADLEELAQTCAALGRWEFLIVIAPWRIRGATSSPVNPIAIL